MGKIGIQGFKGPIKVKAVLGTEFMWAAYIHTLFPF